MRISTERPGTAAANLSSEARTRSRNSRSTAMELGQGSREGGLVGGPEVREWHLEETVESQGGRTT